MLDVPDRKVSLCDCGGTPVTASSFDFNCPMVHEGVILRSEWELSEKISMGISCVVCMVIDLSEFSLCGRRELLLDILFTSKVKKCCLAVYVGLNQD